MPAVGALALLILLGVLALMFRVPEIDKYVDQITGLIDTELGTLLTAQAAILSARNALNEGSAFAFDELTDAGRRLRSTDLNGLSPDKFGAIRGLKQVIDTVLNGRAARETITLAANEMAALLPELEVRSNEFEELNTVQSQAVLTAQLQRLSLLGRSLRGDIQGLAVGSGDPGVLILQMLEADLALAQIAAGLRDGDPELGLRAVAQTETGDVLAAMAATIAKISATVKSVIELSDQLGVIAQSRKQLDVFAVQLAPDEAMASGMIAISGGEGQRNALAGLLGLVMLIIFLMGWTFYRSSDMRRVVERQAEQSDRNQNAIMRLLDELSNLADGDLTVKATVGEDITGAIADSINYAIEALRELVTTVNESAIMVDGAVRQTDATAHQLAEAGEAQSAQIAAASQAIHSMTVASEEISGNAERSSDVARYSVDVAHKGGDAVRRTIEGMNTIRETIQETAKRIKRLGESSQEIGDIVELINDIADQTNILALNASIQASMAGEAGRGFAVVADEVQRLAERSAKATKQIEVLVRTIQTDTNEAVVSMERSTTDVVGGALLAENAGAALEEIEQVSNQIATLVQNISGAAKQQVSAGAIVTRNMDGLQEINTQTAVGMNATTQSISKLAELAAQLRQSVAGFRLPAAELEVGLQAQRDETELDENIVEQSVTLEADEVQLADRETA